MGRPQMTRAEDEAVLEMLALRRKMTSVQVAFLFGQSDTSIRVATNRVMKADSEIEARDLSQEYAFLTNSQAQKVRHNA